MSDRKRDVRGEGEVCYVVMHFFYMLTELCRLCG